MAKRSTIEGIKREILRLEKNIKSFEKRIDLLSSDSSDEIVEKEITSLKNQLDYDKSTRNTKLNLLKVRELEMKLSNHEDEIDSNFEDSIHDIIQNIKQYDTNFEWVIEDGNLICSMRPVALQFFHCLESYNIRIDELEIIDLANKFTEDIKMNVLTEQAIDLIKYVNDRPNDESLRKLFGNLDDLISKSVIIDDSTSHFSTHLYLKDITNFIIFVITQSKKKNQNLLRRFDGFNLIDLSQAKEGDMVALSSFENKLKGFFKLLEGCNIDEGNNNNLCASFLDYYTDYLDIHLLATAMGVLGNDESKINNFIEFLELKAPLSKRFFTAFRNLKILSKTEILQTYSVLFKQAKDAFDDFVSSQEIFRKKGRETNISHNIRRYDQLKEIIGDLDYYEELVEVLIFEAPNELIFDAPEEVLFNFNTNDKSKINNSIYIPESSYSLEHLNKSYQMIYNYRYKKEKKRIN